MTHDERVYHHLYVESKSPLENAERIAALEELTEGLQAENAKLRELCVSLYEFAMSEYPDGTELNFADRLRELGVEVDG